MLLQSVPADTNFSFFFTVTFFRLVPRQHFNEILVIDISPIFNNLSPTHQRRPYWRVIGLLLVWYWRLWLRISPQLSPFLIVQLFWCGLRVFSSILHDYLHHSQLVFIVQSFESYWCVFLIDITLIPPLLSSNFYCVVIRVLLVTFKVDFAPITHQYSPMKTLWCHLRVFVRYSCVENCQTHIYLPPKTHQCNIGQLMAC